MKLILFKDFKAYPKKAVFIEKLKIAKFIPVFKKGEKWKVEKFRRISILSVFSKVLKCII